jgi:hypothetical protein
MTTTELIELLKLHEKGASGRSREISIWTTSKKKGNLQKAVLKESDSLILRGTGDGCAGAELILTISHPEATKEPEEAQRIKQLEKELDFAEAALRQAGYYQQENGEWSAAH